MGKAIDDFVHIVLETAREIDALDPQRKRCLLEEFLVMRESIQVCARRFLPGNRVLRS